MSADVAQPAHRPDDLAEILHQVADTDRELVRFLLELSDEDLAALTPESRRGLLAMLVDTLATFGVSLAVHPATGEAVVATDELAAVLGITVAEAVATFGGPGGCDLRPGTARILH